MNITNFVVSHRDNALLIGDYKTYHHQLTKQLASLRKRLGRATSKNAKFSKKAAVTAEDVGRNKEYVCDAWRLAMCWGAEDTLTR
jgi:signal recognition particle subunit SRP68